MMIRPVKRFSNDLVINEGFRVSDQRVLRETDPTRNPRIQVFTEDIEELEDEESPEETTKICPTCENYDLKYWNKIGFWYCRSCGLKVDSGNGGEHAINITEEQDMYPPTAQLDRPTYADAERDTSYPYFVSFNPDKEEQHNDGFEITYQSTDKRIEHRKVRDMSRLGEALKF